MLQKFSLIFVMVLLSFILASCLVLPNLAYSDLVKIINTTTCYGAVADSEPSIPAGMACAMPWLFD
jgi:hypothetical protein